MRPLLRLKYRFKTQECCTQVVVVSELIRIDASLMSFAIRSVGETGKNVVSCEIVKVLENLFRSHSCSEIIQHIVNGHSQTSNAGFAIPLSGLQCEDVVIVHNAGYVSVDKSSSNCWTNLCSAILLSTIARTAPELLLSGSSEP